MSPRTTSALAVAVLLGGVLTTAAVWANGHVLFLDDAWITIHNARHFGLADDPSFPGQPPLASATSLVHTVLVAALGRLGVPWPWTVALLTWLGVAVMVAGLAVICQDSHLPRSSRLTVIALSILGWYLPFHWFGGLETSLAMAAVTWLLRAQLAGWAPWWTPWLVGLLPWLRPDLALVALLAAIEIARYRGPQSLVTVVIAASPWMALALLMTGGLLPATVHAKRAFFGAPTWGIWLVKLAQAVAYVVAQNAALVAGGTLAWTKIRGHRQALVGALVFIAPTLLTAPNLLAANQGRYIAPLVPWMLVGLVLLHRTQPALSRAALIVAALMGIAATPRMASIWQDGVGFSRAMDTMSTYVRQHDLPGPILVHDVGHVSEHTHRQFVDLVGLKTPLSAAVHRAMPLRRLEAVAEVACRTKSRTLITTREWQEDLLLLDGLRAAGWQTQSEFETGPQRFDYVLYQLTPPVPCQ